MNKDNSIVGTRNILTAVWHEIDVCKKGPYYSLRRLWH